MSLNNFLYSFFKKKLTYNFASTVKHLYLIIQFWHSTSVYVCLSNVSELRFYGCCHPCLYYIYILVRVHVCQWPSGRGSGEGVTRAINSLYSLKAFKFWIQPYNARTMHFKALCCVSNHKNVYTLSVNPLTRSIGDCAQ